ncbi:putative mrna export factor elf1 [Violaceomyces palustris]|uniref:Mrna export factor elf1 n=1 Tax=Violaceomyces palustris TaxID=1673888 RepID=A0ACD0NY01_9BASI|nr:putative mrna export factor elf1 [Violaceomyces palustris]
MAENGTTAAGILEALYKAPSAEECHLAAEQLANYINTVGLRSIQSEGIVDSLLKAAKNKKSGYEREAAAVGLGAIFTKVAGKNAPQPLGADAWLIDTLPTILELYTDKGEVVRSAAESAASSLLGIVPSEAAPELLDVLYQVIDSGSAKWQAKVGALKLMSRLSGSASEQVGDQLVELIPHVTNAMHETKAEVSKQAIKTATKICEACLDNNDIRPFIPDLVGCMARPDSVPECIKKLSSTTFVAEVTGPALAVMVPLLARALNERSQAVQRQTVIVVDNLCKLVRDPHQATRFLPALTPGVERIEKGASFPEVREHAKSASDTLKAATKAVDGTGEASNADPKKVFEQAKAAALDHLLASLQGHLPPGREDVRADPWALTGLDYVAKLIVRLADKRIVQASAWDDVYVLPYLRRICASPQAAKAATDGLRQVYVELDKSRFGKSEDDDDEVTGECLCRTEFSLAYGGLLLLNHTTLKLHRGHRYGIVAANGSGKSTLLKAMRDGKVEGYPTQDVVRTVMVEHSLQGEDASQPILDFICGDKKLVHRTKDEVAAALLDVGFDSEKQQNPVASLSGGWKMKLELARAMLIGADILLLDEPTNHLDVGSVAWLENYLTSNPNITCLIVSHDSGFLDNVCTDIIHYEKKKLKYYKGNLSAFVANKPEAKSFYSLAATSVKFSFPPPGSLMGVRSNTRTILKMTNCTVTYPGMSKPSLRDASCGVSLSSRVGVLGPNGAGKSTLIKCLTGEIVPSTGKVEKHPNLRIAMMAQHAFHHLEQHLEKTACEYIAWRYQDGHDREVTEKASRKMSEEEREQMETAIVAKTGESRKVEFIVGRQKLKKSYQYEIKWRGLEHRHNTWIPRERLLELGFDKMVQQFDDFESSREGAGSREISVKLIRQHLEAVGLQGEIAQHHALSGYSGGQKVKVVLAAAMWNNPQLLVLDEPTNYLDRDALGGLATAIRDWAGAVIIISHNMEFVGALCPEIWNVDNGQIVSKTRTDLAENAFGDDNSSTPGVSAPGTPAPGSKAASRLTSKAGTPVSSAAPTPVGSDNEEQDMSKFKAKKGKKKMTRNEKKAQEERRRLRLTNWLNYGGEREPDTDDEN